MSVLLQDAYLDKLHVLNAGDLGSIPGLGKSPGERKGYSLQYCGLEKSMDCIVYGVTELDTTEQLSLHSVEKRLNIEQKSSISFSIKILICMHS